MKTRPSFIHYPCPVCEADIEIDITPEEAPIYYPNDKADPGTPFDYTPGECPECGTVFDGQDIYEHWSDIQRDADLGSDW